MTGAWIGVFDRTYFEQLRVGEHALPQTSVQKIDVVLHQLVDGPVDLLRSSVVSLVGAVDSVHESPPVRFDDLRGAEV